ncbi:MAG: hypothetical protein APR54_02535 [Candidatus Cloacimonas sp. SDB]|nr:MAG: hypothetical protein APR54_02535 [Candidatus Cloacimonas sp. SDB]
MKLFRVLFIIFLLFGCTVQRVSGNDLEIQDSKQVYDNWVEELKSANTEESVVKQQIREQADEIAGNYSGAEELDLARQGFLLLETKNDSLRAAELEDNLTREFPVSRQTWDRAKEEFYDKIYPVWNDDSLKIDIIKELLPKYSQTGWRRTMYQYLLHSLNRDGDDAELEIKLQEFRNAFPHDYLPYLISARYLKNIDNNAAFEFALHAYKNSYNYPFVDYYPPLEWGLEKRAAIVNTAAVLADFFNEQQRYEESISLLQTVINKNELTVEDETTLAGCYLQLVKAFEGAGQINLAMDSAVNAIIAGDSRNVHTPVADSMLSVLITSEKANTSNLEFSRNLKNYQDVVFTDVTDEYGLEDVNAGRIAWGDFNADGWQDLLLNGSRLFQNQHGRGFNEVTAAAFPDTIKGNGGLWADFDNDGDLDIITKDPESIWLNEAGIFRKISGFPDNFVSTEGIGVADINGDGFLDIYLANYEKNYVYEQDQFYLGNAELEYVDSARESGLIPEDSINRAGRGVNCGDYDNDGDQDIFVSNYRLTENFLWENDGSGSFNNCAVELNVSGVEIEVWWGHTIGSEWCDLDNDGNLDLISCNLAHPRYIDFSNKTMLLYNSGYPEFKFTDKRAEAGIRFEETHSEPALGDLDNDGYQDLFINSVYENRRSFLYKNNQNGTFRDITYLSGTRHFNGWGVAFADFDNDGDLDILAAGGKVQLFRNDTENTGNWLQVEVIGKDHCDAIGTRLILKNEKLYLMREIQGGKGSTNQHSLIQHFGLGEMQPPFDLIISFPSGEKRNLKIEDINRRIIVQEGRK